MYLSVPGVLCGFSRIKVPKSTRGVKVEAPKGPFSNDIHLCTPAIYIEHMTLDRNAVLNLSGMASTKIINAFLFRPSKTFT